MEWRPQLRRRLAIYRTVKQSFGWRRGLRDAVTASYVRPLPPEAYEWGRKIASREYVWNDETAP